MTHRSVRLSSSSRPSSYPSVDIHPSMPAVAATLVTARGISCGTYNDDDDDNNNNNPKVCAQFLCACTRTACRLSQRKRRCRRTIESVNYFVELYIEVRCVFFSFPLAAISLSRVLFAFYVASRLSHVVRAQKQSRAGWSGQFSIGHVRKCAQPLGGRNQPKHTKITI